MAAAARIEQFVQDIERQVRWTTQAAFDDPVAAQEQREIDYLRLLRNVPAIAEISHLDASGKERLRVSRLALDAIGSQEDYSRAPKFLEARAGKTYFSPVYFRNESEPYMTIAVPAGEHGVEVTAAEVNLKAIWDVVSRIRIGKAGYAYVVDSLGRLVAHPDISLVLQKRDLSALPQVRSARGPTVGRGRRATSAWWPPGLHGGQFLTAYAADRAARMARVRRAAARRGIRAPSSLHRPQRHPLRSRPRALGPGERAPGPADGRPDPGPRRPGPPGSARAI